MIIIKERGLNKPLMYDTMTSEYRKTKILKKMKKLAYKIKPSTVYTPLIIGVLVLAYGFSAIGGTKVMADRYQEQINALSADSDQKRQAQGVLSVEADSLSEAISMLQGQIDASQTKINQLTTEIDNLRTQIKQTEEELAKQKKLLGDSIRAMYVSGDITTAEMLMSSKDLSDFFDKQQYQDSVRSKVKTTLDKVTQLKLELNTKKESVEKAMKDQQSLMSQLASQKAEKDRILSMNQSQQDELSAQIKNNSSKIADLRAQQIAENARLFARSGGIINVPDSSGYPWANYRAGSWTHAGSCYYGDDIDRWGLCYRQCVSYAAWKTYKTHGYMPYGFGNANNWDDAARSLGIPVDTNPRPGDIAVSNYGTWGHVMFVERVNPNGTIYVSQYNASLTGTYSEATVSASGLYFIHF